MRSLENGSGTSSGTAVHAKANETTVTLVIASATKYSTRKARSIPVLSGVDGLAAFPRRSPAARSPAELVEPVLETVWEL